MKALLLAMTLVPALAIPACTTSPSAVKGGAEVRTNTAIGTAATTLSAPLEKSYRAALKAVEDDMKFTLVSKALDATKGVINAKMADGTLVDLTLEKMGDQMTSLSVSAGLGKSDAAQTLVTKIQERVK